MTTETSRALLWVLGAAVVLAGLLIVLLPRLSGTSSGDNASTNDPPQTAVASANRDDATGSASSPGPDDKASVDGPLLVGAVTMRNAWEVLAQLDDWARQRSGGTASVTCRMGAIGELAVQLAFCGPTGVDDAGNPTFDQVPLDFETVSDGVVLVRALTDDVFTDEPAPGGLRLIGRDGVIDPASLDG